MTANKRRYVEPLQDHLLYRDCEVAAIYGCHPITIWRLARKGIIPAPIKVAPNMTRWSGKAIRLDLEAKADKGDWPARLIAKRKRKLAAPSSGRSAAA